MSPPNLPALFRDRISRAREIQRERFTEDGIHSNAQMTSLQLRKYCPLDEASQSLLKNAMEKFGLSARAYDRILKVARTIADLDGETDLKPAYVAESIQYRNLDRKRLEELENGRNHLGTTCDEHSRRGARFGGSIPRGWNGICPVPEPGPQRLAELKFPSD